MECFTTNSTPGRHCYETLLETMAEGVIFIDSKNKIRYCNRAFSQLVKLSPKSLIGRDTSNFFTPELFKNDQFLQRDDNEKCFLKNSEGESLSTLKNCRPIKESGGDVHGAVATFRDITSYERAEARFQALQQEKDTQTCCKRIIGHGKSMREVFTKIELSAASEATILITGETGTGKELVADAIHQSSPRKNGPFIKLNCSAIPENLLESELFGHVKGSFTGAINDRPGKFELADGGTLFLDEIGELTPLIQVKLLRFLQERTIERVGGTTVFKADVRIITATHRDLHSLVLSGDFREDLFYRLKVFPIHLPPLRERKEDMGALIQHFISKFNRSTGKSIESVGSSAGHLLMDHCWPGNVRELENAIEHAFVTCQNSEIAADDLPIELRSSDKKNQICNRKSSTQGVGQITEEMIIDALEKSGGNKSAAAQILQIDRSTLWRQMKKFNL